MKVPFSGLHQCLTEILKQNHISLKMMKQKYRNRNFSSVALVSSVSQQTHPCFGFFTSLMTAVSRLCVVCRLLWFVFVSWCRCSLFILSFLFLMAALVWPAELYLSLIPLGKTNMSAHTVGWNLSYRKTFNSSRRLSSDIFILWLLLRPNCLLETKNFASFIILFPWIALMYFSQPIDGQHALHCCYLNYLKL